MLALMAYAQRGGVERNDEMLPLVEESEMLLGGGILDKAYAIRSIGSTRDIRGP